MQGAGKPALPVQLTETHSALMRYGVGTSSANDIVNAICSHTERSWLDPSPA